MSEKEQQKLALVGQLNAIQEKIDAYWLDLISYDSSPFKELIEKRKEIEHKIKELNQQIEQETLSI